MLYVHTPAQADLLAWQQDVLRYLQADHLLKVTFVGPEAGTQAAEFQGTLFPESIWNVYSERDWDGTLRVSVVYFDLYP